MDYLINVSYTGDNKLNVFKNTWLEIITRMRPEDVPSNNALRDTLYNKIKDSPALKMEFFVHYHMLSYDDPKRTYQHFLNIMDRIIMREREKRNRAQTKSGLRQIVEGKDMLAAPARPANNNKERYSKCQEGSQGEGQGQDRGCCSCVASEQGQSSCKG